MPQLRDPAPILLRSSSRTHVGSVRQINEDRVLDRPDLGLWAIADGMGGHQRGDAAAELVIDAIGAVSPGSSGYALLADVTNALAQANTTLHAQAGAQTRSGATMVALLAREDHYACLWCGDSRAYLLRGAALLPITHDHSLVQQLIDRGALGEEARHTHPQANIVTRAMGASAQLEVEQRFGRIEPGDTILLCSDGLTSSVTDDRIRQILLKSGDEAPDALLCESLRTQARDNVSFLIVSARSES